MSEIVVWEGVSRLGLCGVHLMRMGGKVERDGWLLDILGRGGQGTVEVKGILEYEEEGLGMWHLWIWWKLVVAESTPLER